MHPQWPPLGSPLTAPLSQYPPSKLATHPIGTAHRGYLDMLVTPIVWLPVYLYPLHCPVNAPVPAPSPRLPSSCCMNPPFSYLS